MLVLLEELVNLPVLGNFVIGLDYFDFDLVLYFQNAKEHFENGQKNFYLAILKVKVPDKAGISIGNQHHAIISVHIFLKIVKIDCQSNSWLLWIFS